MFLLFCSTFLLLGIDSIRTLQTMTKWPNPPQKILYFSLKALITLHLEEKLSAFKILSWINNK